MESSSSVDKVDYNGLKSFVEKFTKPLHDALNMLIRYRNNNHFIYTGDLYDAIIDMENNLAHYYITHKPNDVTDSDFESCASSDDEQPEPKSRIDY